MTGKRKILISNPVWTLLYESYNLTMPEICQEDLLKAFPEALQKGPETKIACCIRTGEIVINSFMTDVSII